MVKLAEKWGYIDTDGMLVIKAKYIKATNFNMGKAIVRDNTGKVLLIDKSGNETDLSGLNIKNFKEFNEGMARVQVKSGNWGFLDTEGNMAIKAKYLKTGDFSGGLAWVRVGAGKMGFIDKTNQLIIEPKYLAAKDFDPASGIALVKDQSEKWIYINKEGTEMQVHVYKLGDFSEGLSCADKMSNPGVFGFIDTNGSWAIEPGFDGAGDFHNGICRVKVKKQWGVIDKEGNFIIEPKYLGLQDFVLVE
jgi:hypothetical protein